MKTIDNFSFQNKKALIRVDFNVPLDIEQKITDETRINAAIPTIKKILKEGGAVIIMSHLGRPENGPEDKFSLKHLLPTLSKKLNTSIKFANDCIGSTAVEQSSGLSSGEVLLLENVRFYKEETTGDKDFAKKLASLANIYVNDAFGTAHRAHASTTIVAEFFKDKCCGYLIQQEIKNTQKVLENPESPFTAIMGGAKISDKILIIERLLDKVEHLIIGGGMSYTFFKAMGISVGNSLVEQDKLHLAKSLIDKAKQKGVGLHLPKDSVIADKFDNNANIQQVDNHSIPDGWMGLDIGEESIKFFTNIIETSKTVLWNGPMGVFEMSSFAQGTNSIAKAVAEITKNGGFSLIGGGDSVAAINKLGYGSQVSFASTGGGALLEYMEGKILPGLKALE